MAAELLRLFDLYWFEYLVVGKTPSPPSPPLDPDHEPPLESKLSRLPTLHVRSLSDQLLSCKEDFTTTPYSLSPDSVLQAPKLQTILSGKEVEEDSDDARRREEQQKQPVVGVERKANYARRKREGSSKSFSDLEFEELKGFMDLGFVFSEEDKNSKLVSIVPGLQRLGKKDGEEEDDAKSTVAVSRPYLSEAWDVLDRRRKELDPVLMNWTIPEFGNEIDMKEHLRFWAQTVASAVR